jgi:hypothetical protein
MIEKITEEIEVLKSAILGNKVSNEVIARALEVKQEMKLAMVELEYKNIEVKKEMAIIKKELISSINDACNDAGKKLY